MNLQKLQQAISGFKTYLRSKKSLDALYKWESLFHFQQNWEVAAPDFGIMYDKSLQNSVTKRLWKADQYVPKKMMSLFIEMDVDYVQHPVFGVAVPQSCPDVPSEVLNPRDTWADKAAYDAQADSLAMEFVNNFAQFADQASDDIMAGAPKASSVQA